MFSNRHDATVVQNAFSLKMESLPQIDYFYGGLSVIDFEFMVTIVVLIEFCDRHRRM